MIIWLNGEFRDAGPVIDAADRGFLLGDGAFETLYVEAGRTAFLARHLERLRQGLSILRIEPPPVLAGIGAVIARLAEENGLSGRAGARVTVTRGAGPRGLAFPPTDEMRPTMLVAIAPAPAPLKTPLRLHLSTRRRYSGAATASFKALGGYVDNLLAFNEARAAGADEALMLNEHGRIAGAASANIFVIDAAGSVVTPPVREGALPGVARAVLLDGLGAHGVAIEERPLWPEDLAGARLFLTNSLRGVQPASFLAKVGESAGAAAGAFQRLQTWYQKRLEQEIAGEGQTDQ